MKKLYLMLIVLTIIGCEVKTKGTVRNVGDMVKIDGKFYYIDKQEGGYTGIIEEYNNEEKLIGRASVKKGMLDGKVEGFTKDGKRKFIQEYSMGVINGKTLGYSDDGTLLYERNYKDGNVEGLYRMYYENGNIKYEESYKDNLIHGKSYAYLENGDLENERNYNMGVLVEEINHVNSSKKEVSYIFQVDGGQSSVLKRVD